MRRAPLLLLVLPALLGRAAAAQDTTPGMPSDRASGGRGVAGVAHYGRWVAVTGAVAFTLMGAHEHENSNREFRRLLDLCHASNADCLLGPDGTYLNSAAEQLYQASVHYDRRARTRLIAGQATLLLAAGLFIADLRHHQGGPGNKPFSPLEVCGDLRTGRALVGVRVTF